MTEIIVSLLIIEIVICHWLCLLCWKQISHAKTDEEKKKIMRISKGSVQTAYLCGIVIILIVVMDILS